MITSITRGNKNFKKHNFRKEILDFKLFLARASSVTLLAGIIMKKPIYLIAEFVKNLMIDSNKFLIPKHCHKLLINHHSQADTKLKCVNEAALHFVFYYLFVSSQSVSNLKLEWSEAYEKWTWNRFLWHVSFGYVSLQTISLGLCLFFDHFGNRALPNASIG